MIRFVRRQVGWVRAALGLYPHPKDRVRPFEALGWRGYREGSFPEEEVLRILRAFLSGDSALSIRHRNRHRETFRIEGKAGSSGIFMKHYRCGALPLYDPRTYLRARHPQKAFRLFYLLAKHGVPTAKILFYLREDRVRIRPDALLATEEISESLDLKSFMLEQYPLRSLDEKQVFAVELGRFMAGLHRSGVCHGDFVSNTMVQEKPRRFSIIDLDSVRLFGDLLARDRKKQMDTVVRRFRKIDIDREFLDRFHASYDATYPEPSLS